MKVLVKFIKIISRYVHSLVVMKKTKKKKENYHFIEVGCF